MIKKLILFCVFIQVLMFMPKVEVAGYGWGFKRNDNHVCPEIGIYAREIEGTSTYYVGEPDKKIVYLTFDAGYDNGMLGGMLEILKEKDVKSTFFVTGDFVKRQSELLKQIVSDGHLVGNHSWSHPNITNLSLDELSLELKKVEDAYFSLIGSDMPKLFRPPAGAFNRQSLLNVQKLGYKTIFWSIAYRDWLTDRQQGSDYALNHIRANLHNGAIILLHTVSKDNLEGLPAIIDEIRSQGYEIKNLDYLVELPENPVVLNFGLHLCKLGDIINDG